MSDKIIRLDRMAEQRLEQQTGEILEEKSEDIEN